MFFKFTWQKIRDFFVKSSKFAYSISLYLIVILSCILSRMVTDENGRYFVPFICCLLLFLMRSIAKFIKAIDIDDNLPISFKRFTTNDGNGIISIEKEDLNDAINYLYDVENYIEENSIKD